MTSAPRRPRSVQIAVWAWAVAAAWLILSGLLAVTADYGRLLGSFPTASVSQDQIRSLAFLFRGLGVLFILVGAGLGYVAGRTAKGDKRFRRASIALAYAIVLLLALCALLFGIVIPLPAAIALLVGALAATRSSAEAWFDAVDPGSDSG